ncbi:MAG: AAA family ATPase [Ferrovum sp.]|nr:AAA family ATPase [Ferrovum sp.]
MIDSIEINSAASFTGAPGYLSGLSKFNFIYGSNGSGKTTISRVIAEEKAFPACNVVWNGGTKLQAMVYNRDFVEKNFNQSAELKGIFTLGQQNIDTLNKIATAKAELDDLNGEIAKLNLALQGQDGTGGKKAELESIEESFKEKCWSQKQKHDAKLAGAFEGLRNNAGKFKARILQERSSNAATLESLTQLEKKAETVFGPAPATEAEIPAIEAKLVIAHEASPILKTRVIGKGDVDIAAMIMKLGNSDWVKVGRVFYDSNEMICPFCQQDTNDNFAQSLSEYFDESFVAGSKAIDDLVTNYASDAARLQQQITQIIFTSSRFLNVEKLKAEKSLLDSIVTINVQRLTTKKKEPSQIVELDSIRNVVSSVKTLIEAANTQIADHNKMVENLSSERLTLTAQVWRYLLDVELKVVLEEYDATSDAIKKAINGMTKKVSTLMAEKGNKVMEIRSLEKNTTSIQPTIDGINAILSSFGFRGFMLAKTVNGTSYKLVRPDGADAKETLSEGERTFVTFLYFYHLLKGSDTESGMTTDRVVVFDDPVSSLDSDILFIVGSLIKGLFDEIRNSTGHIKQIFVLTHNVYFYKEVTFNPIRRGNVTMNEETFWIVRKVDLQSKLEKHDSNPISTSYGLLWAEVQREDRSKLTIQNTLRRILENYFKILGGVDPDSICAMFEGKEKLICKSLFSWVNDGSHYAHDDLYVSIDNSIVDMYLKVFKAIFEKSGHLAHYSMMMGDASTEGESIEAGHV